MTVIDQETVLDLLWDRLPKYPLCKHPDEHLPTVYEIRIERKDPSVVILAYGCSKCGHYWFEREKREV